MTTRHKKRRNATDKPSNATLHVVNPHAASPVQHLQKALEQMNVKLTEVASSIVGLTGSAILQAILQGERDPHRLAALRHERCQKSAEEYAKALQGTWRPEHLFALRQSWELYQFHQRQITECDRAVAQELTRLPDRSAGQELPPRPRRCGPKPNDVRFEARAGLFRALGVDLTAIDGLDVATVLVILGELGLDVNKFPTEKHFASWLGLCPRVARSNKAEKRRGVRKGKNRVAQALRLAAQAASRTKTALAGFYQRMKGRLGGRGAITATAHKLAVLVYRLLKHGAEYVRVSLEEYEAKQRASCERRLHRLAESLGYQVVPAAAGTAGG